MSEHIKTTGEIPDWFTPIAIGLAIGACIGMFVTKWYYGII